MDWQSTIEPQQILFGFLFQYCLEVVHGNAVGVGNFERQKKTVEKSMKAVC